MSPNCVPCHDDRPVAQSRESEYALLSVSLTALIVAL
jgi:hypothetical protein